jgi:PEP-CTERM motif
LRDLTPARIPGLKFAVAGVLGSSAILSATSAFAIPETEPNNAFPGQAAALNTDYTGIASSLSSDPDFYSFTGLTPGSSYVASLSLLDLFGEVRVTEMLSASITGGSATDTTNNGVAVTLAGLVGASGGLSFRINTPLGFAESYSFRVSSSPQNPRIPEPATLALAAAGLLAAVATRRRRRK